MGSPGVSVEDFLRQGPQAGILRVGDEELQVGGQQQALQHACHQSVREAVRTLQSMS